MGATLPKCVDSTVVERHGSKSFEVAVSEMNGWRNDMEDAHLVFMRDDYGVFGVYDGHGGSACSKFVAQRLTEELEKNGCPKDEATVKKLFIDVDQEFLDSQQASGTTATMCIVRKPASPGGKQSLHVINAGDSRVVLGRRDGSIVDGNGTDKGLTRDHKPEDPIETERIKRCGGTVEIKEGNVARVNGNLSVCRGFGDAEEKKTGGPLPDDRPVTVVPDQFRFECDEADFLLLVCDGVSEGNFPNEDVVKLVAETLKNKGSAGEAAKAVCHKAVATDSKDNITCMVVLLSGTDTPFEKTIEFAPGAIDKLGHKGFRTAYTAMAAKAGLSLAQAADKRYEVVKALLKTASTKELEDEASLIGTPSGEAGSETRTQWFENWISQLPEEKDDGPGGMNMDMIQNMMAGKGGGGDGGKGKGKGKDKASGYQADEEEVEKEESGYTWSQKGEEVQVLFKLPKQVTKKDVKVTFKMSTISVAVQGESLLDGKLASTVDTDDCTWCLAGGGSELQVMLTKQNPKDVWKGLLK